MAVDSRRKDVNWDIYGDNGWQSPWSMESYQAIQVAVLMDLRDELQQLNRLLACPNFVGIPFKLTQIERNTRKAKRKRVQK